MDSYEGGVPAFHWNISEWFLTTGNLMITMGWLMRCYIKDTKKRLPKSLGIALMIVNGFGCILHPVSGYWTAFALGTHIAFCGDDGGKQ